MENLFDRERSVTKIGFVATVPAGTGSLRHRARPFYGLVFSLGGKTVYRFIDGTEFTLSENEIIFLPAGADYDVTILTPGDCIAVNFYLDSTDLLYPFRLQPKNTMRANELFKTADKVWITKRQGYLFRSKSLLYEILYLLETELNPIYLPKSKAAILSPAMDYLENNYYRTEIKIKDLATLSGVSEVYFRKIFTSIHHMTPLKFINHLKISRAVELIESGFYKVREIAELLHYESESHFSRSFKQVMGLSPKQYAQIVLNHSESR